MKLKEIIQSRDPLTINYNYKIKDALELMRKGNTNFLLVVNDRNEVIGIVTQRAITRALGGNANLDTKISDIMIKTVITASGNEELLDVFILMAKNNVNHLVVVDSNGKAVGVVSLRDVLYAIQRECEVE
ncbi:CBS domain-containing protein [Saccharolobus caldissimus]|uniref:Histidine kinase n=1 Tax=Saccharolobus caldissimus TaxID=1702097 RepID=A0AAQ4CUP3_9CREN|nr:CBS domain-containing protein [Saccharolobus caldissimus]BDB99524.1 histidine kinase [Saccharolobus caldissimus]